MKISQISFAALKYFVDTLEEKSLTKAAEKNFVTRPAISQAIKKLEMEIGESLIEHRKRLLIFTPAGKSFYLKAKEILRYSEQILLDQMNQANSLNIGTSLSLAESVVLEPLKKMNSLRNIQLSLKIGTTHKIRQHLFDKEINIGIVIDDGKTYGLEMILLFEGRFKLYSKSGELENPIISTENRPEVLELKKYLLRKKIDFNSIQLESWHLCHHTAQKYGGTCLIPDFYEEKSALKVLRSQPAELSYKVFLLTRNTNQLSTFESLFVSRLSKLFK